MNKSKKRINKRYIRYKRAKKSLQKNRKQILRNKNRSRILKKNKLNNRRYKRSLNMKGGGIPFAGSIKGLLGLTHNLENSRENMISEICSLNSVNPSNDYQLSGLMNQVCSLNENIKKDKQNSGVVKGVMRLIGNMATLPLKTASGVVKNITGFDASEAALNAIRNNISKDEVNKPNGQLYSQQQLSGNQSIQIQ